METLVNQLEQAQADLDPQFKALRKVMSALRTATRLAAEEKADALPMHKALVKLETAAAEVENDTLDAAVNAFTAATNQALDNLAYDFAKDLRDSFADRGETVSGRPPVLAVGMLTLRIDMAARKGQWLYGKEALTRPVPLSINGIIKAYDRQAKRIAGREIKTAEYLQELYKAWDDCLQKRSRRPAGGRINIVEVHSQITLNRQTTRFWNAPSRSTFKDYDRALFARDLCILREEQVTQLTVDGKLLRLRLGVATKSQAEQANRSLWLPDDALTGEYYSDVTFD